MSDFINQFPYSDFHELNLDWIIKTVKDLDGKMNTFEAINTIKYDGAWDINKQYEKWTVVNDSDYDYLSLQIVPAGININNTDYWMMVAPLKIDQDFNSTSINAISNKTVTNKFSDVDDDISDIQGDIATMRSDISTNTNQISNEIAAREGADTVINARIDSIASLAEGSTTGDAELMDIRVAYNGETYPSAGDAVRAQVSDVNDKFDAITERTENLWPLLADKPFTTSLVVPIVLTPETYTISVSGITSAASGTSSRIEFFDSTDTRLAIINESITNPASENYLTPRRDGSLPLSFTLQNTTAYVKLYSANTASGSTGYAATWEDVMIVKGKYNDKGTVIPLPYISPLTAVDIIARSALSTKLLGKTIVNFGDSIFGNFTAPTDISSFIEDMTGAKVYNCGFGGTRMTDNSAYGDKGYFSMCKLAEAVATGVFTAQTSALARMQAASDPAAPMYAATLNRLMAIDFSNVDIITFEHGTNDWYGDTTLSGGSGNLVFTNALEYVIDTISTAYPGIRIIVISPIYRYFSATSDSNNYVNTKGNTLIDYVNAMSEIAGNYNLQFINDYMIGINKYSHALYLSDGTHPTEAARKLIASNISKELY